MSNGYFTQLVTGFLSLLSGMWVTLKNLFRRPVTLTYPHQKPELSEKYRSAIQLVRFDQTGTHDCVACMQCVNICPSFCIHVEGEKPEGLKRKRATEFKVDFALCSLCGLCLDVCPTDTLTYSKIYDEVGYRRDNFVYDLLEDFRAGEQAHLERARAEEREKAEKAAAAKEKAAAAKEKTAAAKQKAAAAEEKTAAAKQETAAAKQETAAAKRETAGPEAPAAKAADAAATEAQGSPAGAAAPPKKAAEDAKAPAEHEQDNADQQEEGGRDESAQAVN